MKTIVWVPIAAGLCIVSPAADGATLILDSGVSVSGGGGVAQPFSFQSDPDALFLSEDLSETVAATADAGFATARSAGSVNARTGEMKFTLDAERRANECGGNACDADFAAANVSRIQETITVDGSGTVSMFMQVDASWESPFFDFNAFVTIFQSGTEGPDKFLGLNSATSTDTSVSRLLFDTFEVAGAINQDVTLTWGIQGQINSNSFPDPQVRNVSGFMDASNTATIYYELSEGLTLVDGTAGFLEAPAYLQLAPAPVPLPAPLFMLGAGVVGLWAGSGRRARRRSP